MPISDLDQALLDLARERGALTETGAERVRAAVERPGGPDFDTAIAEAVAPERLRELCRELPDFYAKRRKLRRTQHGRAPAPSEPRASFGTGYTDHEPAPRPAADQGARGSSAGTGYTEQGTRPPGSLTDEAARRAGTGRTDAGARAPTAAGAGPASLEAVARWFEAQGDGETPEATQRIGPYTLEKELGRGGLGVVYRARRHGSEKAFALKLLTLEGDAIASRRFVREIRALAKVEHPNVVKIYDCDQSEGKLYYAMELLDGAPLADLIEAGPVDPVVLKRVTRDCLAGLGAIHAAGILHRDVKPANILVERSGRAVIIDFSVASVPDASLVLTQQGFAVGTPMFMAPEQVRGDPVTAATDLYSLGITLWLALEGKSPYGKDLETYEALADAKLGNPPPPITRPGVPAAFAHFVLKLMATAPADRFTTAAEALAELEAMNAAPAAPPAAPKAAPVGAATIVESEPRTIGKYAIVRTVGRGAHATVYLARDPQGREAALKVLDRGAEASSLARLTHESRVLARIQHPHVARLHEAGITQGQPFLALEWVNGGTLEDLCRSSGRLPLEAVLTIGAQLASALAAVHACRIVHRDLKPENILVSHEGDVKLADFGLARVEEDQEPAKQAFQGTPTYAAPEQCKGEPATRRSDLYALGGILFRMAAGRMAFLADAPAAFAYKHLRETPPPLEQLVPEAAPLAPLVAALLEKSPEKRYETADALARDLVLLGEGKPPEALPGAPPPDPRRPWWRVW